MTPRPTFVVVGASLAGAHAVATLRKEGFDGRIVLVGAEPHLPYERPPLSKEYLRGEVYFEKILVRPAERYEEEDVELRLGTRAVGIDTGGRAVELAGGEMLVCDKVLVATGVRNRHLPVPGADLTGVFNLRSAGDADGIRAEVAPGRRAVLIGLGFIGSEVAASLRRGGVEVVVVEAAPRAFQRVLGEQIGQVIEEIHREEGVSLLFNDTVEAFEGSTRLEAVRTAGGRRLPCDFAVVGIGVEPVVEPVAGAGIRVDNGIVVDEYCRTNIDAVYAAGDVARHYHPLAGGHTRVEHWQNAILQGAAAARNMLGRERPYAEVHWFWSDQYDHNLQYAGFHGEWDEVVIRGSLQERRFVAYYLNQGRVRAAAALNRGTELRRSLPLLASATQVDPAVLADSDTDLRRLVAMHEPRPSSV